jgi:hypothetical protein
MKSPVALLLLPALFLAACTSKAPPVVNALSGTLADGGVDTDSEGKFVLESRAWTGGAGTVNLELPRNSAQPAVVLASAPLGADGKFSFASLPVPAASDLIAISDEKLPENCTGEIKFSDPAARGNSLTVMVKTENESGEARQQTVDTAAQTVKFSTLFYVDRAVKITGMQTCAQQTGSATFAYVTDNDVQLHKGWNTVVLSSQVTATPATATTPATVTSQTSARNGDLGTAKWYVFGNSAQSLSLKNAAPSRLSLFR